MLFLSPLNDGTGTICVFSIIVSLLFHAKRHFERLVLFTFIRYLVILSFFSHSCYAHTVTKRVLTSFHLFIITSFGSVLIIEFFFIFFLFLSLLLSFSLSVTFYCRHPDTSAFLRNRSEVIVRNLKVIGAPLLAFFSHWHRDFLSRRRREGFHEASQVSQFYLLYFMYFYHNFCHIITVFL